MALNTKVWYNAKQSVNINNLDITGEKGSSNGHINFKTPRFYAKNCEITGSLYNVFEGSQVANVDQKEVMIENINCEDPQLLHNILNVYTPANNATITIKNCKFDLNVANSNVLRMSNYHNAENVTVIFDNVSWNYEGVGGSEDDFAWAGLMLFQPAGGDISLTGDLSKIKTWTIKIRNCKYNGAKVASNNFGAHNQCVYVYNVGGDKSMEDGSKIFTMKFE